MLNVLWTILGGIRFIASTLGIIGSGIVLGVAFWDELKASFVWLLDGLLWMIMSVLFLFFDGFLTFVTGFFQLLDVGQYVFTASASWSSLPPQLIYVINQIGLPEGLTLLSGAYVIRLLMNLIPSWLTRA